MGKGLSNLKVNEGNHKGERRFIGLCKHLKVMKMKISQTKLKDRKRKKISELQQFLLFSIYEDLI